MRHILLSAFRLSINVLQMLVSEKVGDVYDRGYSSASGPYQPFSNQIGSDLRLTPAPGPGHTDYSQQWAEYYR